MVVATIHWDDWLQTQKDSRDAIAASAKLIDEIERMEKKLDQMNEMLLALQQVNRSILNEVVTKWNLNHRANGK